MLAENWYSTQPFLAWCLNHFFFNRVHFAYIAAPFHPYRLPNPASSDPWRTYGAQYEPWADDDPYDPHPIQKRQALRRGVDAHAHRLTPFGRYVLNYICARIEQRFLMPIVYRVDLAVIDPARRTLGGSALIGSQEWRIVDLNEDEFDILYFDVATDPFASDPDLADVGGQLLDGSDRLSGDQALLRLLARCH